MSAVDRLEAYRQIIARRPEDGHRRGSTVTQAGAPDRHERWRALAAAFLAYVMSEQDEGRHSCQ
jgi:hypothetical protein